MKNMKFTLIELLIVISIIAILASMLLPALGKARDSAKTSLCSNNLRQLAAAMGNYASDYNGWGAYGVQNGNFLYGPALENMYDSTLCYYINFPVKESAAIGPPAPISICPSGRRDGTGDRTSTGNPNFSYSFNNYLCTGDGSTYSNHPERASRVTDVRKPSRRLFCADANCHANTLYSYEYFPARHANGTDNIVFVDNHTEKWIVPEKAATLTGSYSGGADGFWHDATW